MVLKLYIFLNLSWFQTKFSTSMFEKKEHDTDFEQAKSTQLY